MRAGAEPPDGDIGKRDGEHAEGVRLPLRCYCKIFGKAPDAGKRSIVKHTPGLVARGVEVRNRKFKMECCRQDHARTLAARPSIVNALTIERRRQLRNAGRLSAGTPRRAVLVGANFPRDALCAFAGRREAIAREALIVVG